MIPGVAAETVPLVEVERAGPALRELHAWLLERGFPELERYPWPGHPSLCITGTMAAPLIAPPHPDRAASEKERFAFRFAIPAGYAVPPGNEISAIGGNAGSQLIGVDNVSVRLLT